MAKRNRIWLQKIKPRGSLKYPRCFSLLTDLTLQFWEKPFPYLLWTVGTFKPCSIYFRRVISVLPFWVSFLCWWVLPLLLVWYGSCLGQASPDTRRLPGPRRGEALRLHQWEQQGRGPASAAAALPLSAWGVWASNVKVWLVAVLTLGIKIWAALSNCSLWLECSALRS